MTKIYLLINHEVDANGDFLLLQKPEHDTIFQCCEELDIGCYNVTMSDVVFGRIQMPVFQTYLWGCNLIHKLAPYPLSSIQSNLYTPLVLHRCCTPDAKDAYYLKNEKLDDVLFSPFSSVVALEGFSPNSDRSKTDDTVYFSKPLLSDKMFDVKKGTLLELENELISGYKEGKTPENKRRFYNITGLCEDKTEYISEEVRNIVLDGKVVSSCMYANDGEEIPSEQYLDYRHSEDSEQWQAAQLILDRYPRLTLFFNAANQPYFVLDTVFDKRDQKWKILELNPFWSSSIFGGDLKPVLKYLVDSHL